MSVPEAHGIGPRLHCLYLVWPPYGAGVSQAAGNAFASRTAAVAVNRNWADAMAQLL